MNPPRTDFDAVLVDGVTIHVRPMRADDGERLEAFHEGLSPESQRLRFFTPHPHLSHAEVDRFTHVDGRQRAAFVATEDDTIIAVARYERVPATDQAEVAFVVTDACQGRGIATLLLDHLAAVARGNGITQFTAETLAENRRMLRVFHDAGFPIQSAWRDGSVQVELSIAEEHR